MEKNNSSFPDMGVFSRKLILLCLLAAIVLLGFFVVLSAGKDPHSTQEPEMVSVSDPGTTPPPGPGGQISPMIVVGGETLYAGGMMCPSGTPKRWDIWKKWRRQNIWEKR